ncbi:hypothetical protein JT739_07765 [Tepidanaerobacter sp. GT38]|uniref:hypothetical protein n=1 Tax=Tepidanaerobacter sp. GT38 TaxID=2722793 RepID=UPI001F19A0D8|nr:hypothetical protein [Tepidanaerobacter sp. GT38]MCG1012496.1 hypothetical protein [Tepidanaerobacter sp. GT38]
MFNSIGKSLIVSTIKRLWPIIFVPIFWDIFKIVAIYMSKFLGYNLYLHENFGLWPLITNQLNVSVVPPFILPSVQNLDLLRNISNQSLSFYNKSWEGLLAFGAYLFLNGLVVGGFFGTLKDSFRNRRPTLRTFIQFAWYYGPRLFIMLLFYNLFALSAIVFANPGKVDRIIFVLKVLFIFLPYLIVMEDFGFFEALLAAPQVFLKYVRYFIAILAKILTINTVIGLLFKLSGNFGLILALFLWPIAGTCVIYAIMLFFNDIVMKEPVAEKPREHIRGYGKSMLNTALTVFLMAIVAGMPTFIAKFGYVQGFMPWHRPVISREGLIYQTEGGRVYAAKNNLSNMKLVIDSLTPSKDEILYAKPGLIRGKGRLLGKHKSIYFTFELTKTINKQDNIIYSLENGGKVEATDALWGNPVDRGMILVIDGTFDNISGIIYDKANYSEFDTLWSPNGTSVFLGPMPNKDELYGFYTAIETPKNPIEFQWIYNSSLPIFAEGERNYIKLMDKLNVSFETLDRDLLLKLLYYVNDLTPDNVQAKLEKEFKKCLWLMEAKGLQNWEQNIRTDVSYYYNSNGKITLMGDYYFNSHKIGYRAELFKIGQRWKITKVSIKD